MENSIVYTNLQVCQPILKDGTNCSNPINFGKYIEEFQCNSEFSSERMLKEMRLSFPSGHSSFSVYTMLYCAVSILLFKTFFTNDNFYNNSFFQIDLFTISDDLARI